MPRIERDDSLIKATEPLQGLHVGDAGELELSPAHRRRDRAHQGVFRGDLLNTKRDRCPCALPGLLLRPWRDGERIKECQLDLFANRISAKTIRANQLRLWFASMAYVLMAVLCPRHQGHHAGQCHPRLYPSEDLEDQRLGPVSVRRIRIAMASAHP